MNQRTIRAHYTAETIRVYQAYHPGIADSAVKNQTFLPPHFKMERMTWIKPSFLWMMYRCGWASKKGQERVLAIDISREGFEWALANSCLSHFRKGFHRDEAAWRREKERSPVRIQWDPERDLRLEKVEQLRAIQIGLSGEAVNRYTGEWIRKIEDITAFCQEVKEWVERGELSKAKDLLPEEMEYPVSKVLETRLGMRNHLADDPSKPPNQS